MKFFDPPQLKPSEIISHSMQLAAWRKRKRLITLIGSTVVIVGAVIITSLVLGNNSRNKPVPISNVVAEVGITDGGFVPASIKIKKGQEITWTNSSAASRGVTADQFALPSFNTTEQMNEGDTYTYIFDKPGTYHYYDPADPKTFVGTIIVTN